MKKSFSIFAAVVTLAFGISSTVYAAELESTNASTATIDTTSQVSTGEKASVVKGIGNLFGSFAKKVMTVPREFAAGVAAGYADIAKPAANTVSSVDAPSQQIDKKTSESATSDAAQPAQEVQATPEAKAAATVARLKARFAALAAESSKDSSSHQ